MKRILAFLLATLTISASVFAQYGMAPAGSPAGATKAQLEKIGKAQAKAKADFAKAPKDKNKKKLYITSTNALATATMMSEVVDRKEKYKIALRLYRDVLKVDPAEPTAKKNSDMIVSIYKSMGRPVPK